MSILCTFPGKFGDLLWALPTVRAVSRRVGEPVDLLIAKPYASISALIAAQPYIGLCASVETWEVQDTAPLSPRAPQLLDSINTSYDQVLHLGYRGWPLPDVVRHTLETVNGHKLELVDPLMESDLHLDEPWITEGARPNFRPWARDRDDFSNIAVGFSDEHFELKYGVTQLMEDHNYHWNVTQFGSSPRWDHEGGGGSCMNWAESLATLQGADVCLACCSALHVLAVAAGVPVVLMEPNPHRHNDVFYPLGKVGPQVQLVLGNDGLPTFDARHVADAISSVVASRPSPRR